MTCEDERTRRVCSPVYVEEPGTSSGRPLKSVLFTELRRTASSVRVFEARNVVGQADSSDYVRALPTCSVVRNGVGSFPVCGVLLLNEGRNMVIRLILFLVRAPSVNARQTLCWSETMEC